MARVDPAAVTPGLEVVESDGAPFAEPSAPVGSVQAIARDDGVLELVALVAGAAGQPTAARLDPAALQAGIARFGAAFGMSPAAVRVLTALHATGDVRRAAAACGIGYETAREHIERARQAVGAANLPRLVSIAVIGSADAARPGDESDGGFGALFGLTGRQVRIAGLLTNGSTRREAAAQMGLSEAVVKTELSLIFAATRVDSVIALARLLAEIRLLAMLAQSGSAPAPPVSVTTHVITGPGGRTIAISDHGPADARPVLVLHSSMTDRAVNSALVAALHAAGWRPVSIDRPGFGGTTRALSGPAAPPYLDQAADDVAVLCTHMGWAAVPVVTRGAAQAMLALHRRHPALIARAVIVNPDPDTAASTRADTFMARIKRNFARRPWAVAAMTRVLVAFSSYERVKDNMLRLTAGCPADAAVMADPANVRDYYAGLVGFREGRTAGFVAEQVELATMGKPAPVPGTPHFAVLVGDQDFLHDPAETLVYWRDVLPDADVRTVAGAGRFMTYSHAALVVAALDG